uniref:Uncharacterized protein n=1 Tax=Graphocephala atropunctata TaxID=36148 RepID=A0A1B6KJQ0_9HEMI
MGEKNRIDELQEKLTETLVDLNHKRKEMPQRCISVLDKNLELQKLQSENIIVLPKTGAKKLTCKYFTDEPLDVTLKIPKAQMEINEFPATISQIKEDQENLFKVIQMCQKKNPFMNF